MKSKVIIARGEKVGIGLVRSVLLALVALTIRSMGQEPGDYRSAGSGSWTDPYTWEVYDGSEWLVAGTFPNNMDSAVTIRSGHQVIYNTSNISTSLLTVEAGGKLYANSSGVYRYLLVYDNILCNGTIGNDTIVDGFSIKPEGDTVKISGIGNCKFRRIRKDADTNVITVLIIDMPVEILYNGTGYGLYNNKAYTYLDIHVNPQASLWLHSKLNLHRSHLTIHSSSTSTGQLICTKVDNSVGINTDVKQYVPKDNTWHFLSSPVEDQVIPYFFVPDPVDNSFDFFKWDEGEPEGAAWINIRDSSGSINPDFEYEFVEGRGYLVAYDTSNQGDLVRTFHGTMLDGNQSLPVTLTNNGWNLLGNPYPCGLDWSSSGIDKSLVGGQAIYLWDEELNSGIGGYRTHNGLLGVPENTTSVVPPMNGFFILALGTGNIDIDISNDNPLTISGQSFYKSEFLSCANLRIAVVRGDVTDETLIGFGPGYHDGYRAEEDALKLFRSHPEVPEVFSLYQGKEMVINNVSERYPDIPLGYITSEPGQLTFDFSELGTIDKSIGIFLEDRHTGNIQSIREFNKYIFWSSSGIYHKRFLIKFKRTGIYDGSDELSAYARINQEGKVLRIQSKTEIPSRLSVVDASGRVIFDRGMPPAGSELISQVPVAGLYIIHFSSSEANHSRKILIK